MATCRSRTYPIALAHGIARFDFLTESFNLKSRKLFGDTFDKVLLYLANSGVSVVQDSLHYFRGIQTFLKADGFDARHTRVGFATGLTNRAGDLHPDQIRILQETKSGKVHSIAPSMAGWIRGEARLGGVRAAGPTMAARDELPDLQ